MRGKYPISLYIQNVEDCVLHIHYLVMDIYNNSQEIISWVLFIFTSSFLYLGGLSNNRSTNPEMELTNPTCLAKCLSDGSPIKVVVY